MTLKLRKRSLFPALVTAESPITLTKNGAVYDFGFDVTALEGSLDSRYINSSFTQSGTGAVTRDFVGKVRETLSITDFGAKGDTIVLFDGAISSGGKNFSSASAVFSGADIGKLIRVVGAGAAGAVLETTIASFVGQTSVMLTSAASTTVSGATVYYGSDDTQAIQNAVNSVLIRANPSRIFIPGKIFMTTSPINVPEFTALSFEGKGASTLSNLGSFIMPSISTDGVDVYSADAVTFHDFGIIYAGSANTNTYAIRFNPPSGQFNQFSRLRDLAIINAYDCINADRLSFAIFDGINASGFTHAGVIYTSAINFGDTGDNKIINSSFFGAASVPLLGVYWAGGGGLTIENTKISTTHIGVQLNPASGVNTSQINIYGMSFDGMTDNAIVYSRQAGAQPLTQFIVANCTGNFFNGTPGFLVIQNDAAGVGVNTVVVVGNAIIGSSSGGTMISIDSADTIHVLGNPIKLSHAAAVGISIGSAVTNGIVGPNEVSGTFANDVINASAGVKVLNAITPSNGGIVYSTADRMAVLAGTATAGQIPRSGSNAAPSWSTATYPNTVAVNNLLYASSANTIAALSTANSGVLVTNGSGVPSISSTLPAITITNTETIDGAAGTFRQQKFTTAGSNRFAFYVDNVAESGANAGSNVNFNLYDDTGAFLSNPWTLTRSTGKTSFNVNISSTSTTTGTATFSGGIGVAGAIYAGLEIATGVYTVATLPTATAGRKGARAFVTDANAATFGTAAAGGGANNVPVWCDGTGWKIG